jgi:hypothetical protein
MCHPASWTLELRGAFVNPRPLFLARPCPRLVQAEGPLTAALPMLRPLVPSISQRIPLTLWRSRAVLAGTTPGRRIASVFEEEGRSMRHG